MKSFRRDSILGGIPWDSMRGKIPMGNLTRNDLIQGNECPNLFKIFTVELWILICTCLLCFSVVLFLMKKQHFLVCLCHVTKAHFGQALQKQSEKSSQKVLLLSLGIYGAFLYWSYSGTLIGNLAYPAGEPPFETTREFAQMNDFRLHVLAETSYYSSFVNNPDREKLKKLINPYTYRYSETQNVINKIQHSHAEYVEEGLLQYLAEFKMSLESELQMIYATKCFFHFAGLLYKSCF